MQLFFRCVLSTVFASVVATCTFGLSAQAADDGMVWQFSEFNDPGNKGRKTARLTFGIPETDAVKLRGVCEAKSSTSIRFSSLTLAADIGNLKEGKSVDVRFSGGGFERALQGAVYGTTAEEGITGVHLNPDNSDALWDALTTKSKMDYMVPGYAANTLALATGHAKIKKFIAACRNYESIIDPRSGNAALKKTAAKKSNTAKPSRGSGAAISEKEAFASAKELGTIEAWEAFLENFPSGFRSDLARAYVKRLASGGGTDRASSPPQTPAPAVRQPAAAPPLQTLDLGAGTDPWRNRNTVVGTAGDQSVYAASVHSHGLDLVTYCVDLNRTGGIGHGLYTVIRENPPGSYPDYAQRVTQGLQNAPRFNAHHREATISLPGGGVHPGMTARQRMDKNELLIGASGQAFSQGSAFSEMLSGKSMTVSLPPFQATFQLTNSRKAICSVSKRCGAGFAGCGGGADESVATPSAKKTAKKRCKKGYYLKRGKCKRKRKKAVSRGCPPGTVQVPETDNCVWKTDKNGFEIAPWKKPGCKTWERQCNQGNGASCRKYEETCQVN